MIPLYGFVEGDTLGLLVLASPDETIAAVAARLQISASVRVARRARVITMHAGQELAPLLTVSRAGLRPLDRIDVVAAREEEA